MLVKSDIKVFNSQFSPSEKQASTVQKNVFAKRGSDDADVFFKANQNYIVNPDRDKDGNYKTPIKSEFEYLEAAKLTAMAGLAVAGRLAWEIIETGGLDSFKDIKTLAKGCLLIGGVYVLAVLPRNLYDRKVDVFRKKRIMGVYVGNNASSQKLYERIADEAKNADSQRKQELTQDYMKLRRAKNQVPVFIRNYQ